MSAPKHVYRIKVDSYPTSDGRPFVLQPHSLWSTVYDNTEDRPTWLTGELINKYGWETNYDYTGQENWEGPLKITGTTTMYDDGPVIQVPMLRRTHYFSRHAAKKIVDVFREWGCTAEIEKSKPIEWEAQ